MNCLWLISSSRCAQTINITNCTMSISEVLMLSYIRRLLRRMISICHNCKPKSNSFSSDLTLNFVDDRYDSWLNLSQFRTHWSCCVDTETHINETKSRKGKMIFWRCFENCSFGWLDWFVNTTSSNNFSSSCCSNHRSNDCRLWWDSGASWSTYSLFCRLSFVNYFPGNWFGMNYSLSFLNSPGHGPGLKYLLGLWFFDEILSILNASFNGSGSSNFGGSRLNCSCHLICDWLINYTSQSINSNL